MAVHRSFPGGQPSRSLAPACRGAHVAQEHGEAGAAAVPEAG